MRLFANLRSALVAPLAALLVTAGVATAGSIQVKDGNGTIQSLLTFTFSGIQAYGMALIDTTGAQVDPATKQGVAGVVTALGSPYQAGGALPLPSGAATAAGQSAMTTALGSPYQAGGALPLPSGAASAANQTTELAAIQALVQAGGKVDTVIASVASDRGAVVGTTSVQLMAANATRRGFSIQNQSATASCYISGLASATADYHSLLIAPGQLYESKDSHTGTGAINAICTAASTSLYSREW